MAFYFSQKHDRLSCSQKSGDDDDDDDDVVVHIHSVSMTDK